MPRLVPKNYLGEKNNWAMDKDKSIIKYLVSNKSAEHNCQSKSLLTYLIITFIFKRSEFKKAHFKISTKAHIFVSYIVWDLYLGKILAETWQSSVSLDPSTCILSTVKIRIPIPDTFDDYKIKTTAKLY